MAEQFLDGADVGTVRKHVRGVGVAQDVRGDALGRDADRGGALAHDLEDALAGERTPKPRQKDVRLR